MTVLLIDDLRDFRPGVRDNADTARTSAAALVLLDKEIYSEVWLDHDLGEIEGKPDTIAPVLDFLCEYAEAMRDYTTCFVHSSNPAGAALMVVALSRFGYNVRRVHATDYLSVTPARFVERLEDRSE